MSIFILDYFLYFWQKLLLMFFTCSESDLRKQVGLSLKKYFSEKGMKAYDVAAKLSEAGQPATDRIVYTYYNGRKFTNAAANIWSKVFGFSADYLKGGYGFLLQADKEAYLKSLITSDYYETALEHFDEVDLLCEIEKQVARILNYKKDYIVLHTKENNKGFITACTDYQTAENFLSWWKAGCPNVDGMPEELAKLKTENQLLKDLIQKSL